METLNLCVTSDVHKDVPPGYCQSCTNRLKQTTWISPLIFNHWTDLHRFVSNQLTFPQMGLINGYVTNPGFGQCFQGRSHFGDSFPQFASPLRGVWAGLSTAGSLVLWLPTRPSFITLLQTARMVWNVLIFYANNTDPLFLEPDLQTQISGTKMSLLPGRNPEQDQVRLGGKLPPEASK